jgi:hypothetical protein
MTPTRGHRRRLSNTGPRHVPPAALELNVIAISCALERAWNVSRLQSVMNKESEPPAVRCAYAELIMAAFCVADARVEEALPQFVATIISDSAHGRSFDALICQHAASWCRSRGSAAATWARVSCTGAAGRRVRYRDSRRRSHTRLSSRRPPRRLRRAAPSGARRRRSTARH